MYRLYDLLRTCMPEMHVRIYVQSTGYHQYLNKFAAWERRQQQGVTADRIGDREGALPDIWEVTCVSLLWHDYFLEIPLWRYSLDPRHFDWCDVSRSALLERASTQEALASFLVSHLWSLREANEATLDPEFLASLPPAARRMPFVEELWEQYRQTASFFGRAFHPLMEAYKQHEDGPIDPSMEEKGPRTLPISEINRLISRHLGVASYNVAVGTKRLIDTDERLAVSIEAYSEEDRQRVATWLMARRGSPRQAIQLVLCELALRSVIPSGQYSLRSDALQ